MATLSRLKRGSVQLQRAAIRATGRLPARHVMLGMVIWAVILAGLMERSVTVQPPPIAPHELVNRSYMNLYCNSGNNTNGGEVAETPTGSPAASEELEASWLRGNANASTSTSVAFEPDLKVPLNDEDVAVWRLQTAWLSGQMLGCLPGAGLCARFGPTRAAGVALLVAGLLQALSPLLWPSPYHAIVRALQGMAIGAVWPCFHTLGTTWYPPLQRTRYITCYSSVVVGHSLAGVLWYLVGRDVLCYGLAVLSSLWYFLWQHTVRDRPELHPRMVPAKCCQLADAIGNSVVAATSPRPPVSWKHFLGSTPVWMCALAQFGNSWGQTTLQLAVTKYLNFVYGFSLTYDRVLTTLPYVGHVCTALTCGMFADFARSQALVSTTTARRFLVYFAHFPTGAILFVLGYCGCDPSAPAALFTAAVIISGASTAGSLASCMDIAPNFAGYVLALSQMLGAAASISAGFVVTEGLHGWLPGSWRLVFGLAAGVLAVTAIAFMAMGSGSAQAWNFPPAPVPPPNPSAINVVESPLGDGNLA